MLKAGRRSALQVTMRPERGLPYQDSGLRSEYGTRVPIRGEIPYSDGLQNRHYRGRNAYLELQRRSLKQEDHAAGAASAVQETVG